MIQLKSGLQQGNLLKLEKQVSFDMKIKGVFLRLLKTPHKGKLLI